MDEQDRKDVEAVLSGVRAAQGTLDDAIADGAKLMLALREPEQSLMPEELFAVFADLLGVRFVLDEIEAIASRVAFDDAIPF
jgi:hypothetical protein